ncbi:MAG: 1,4-dihydroxy-2-naphthoate polyprenyltransferase [Bacteroidales bacterium]|nr:1,4-dihydroxy-2-naphthoate polyprenyltransferase [Bacteroidales bacterium]MDZ4203263.1 1,4-dihydroxy-2-naphthoate polyprenyltransferase [Bacteroidales bacterium]
MSRTKISNWLQAFRLRTLPLALSTVLLGAFLAYFDGAKNWLVSGLALATTLFLQILSNLANDYGDSAHGLDNEKRVGPKRTVQSGNIGAAEMKLAIIIFTLLSLSTGILLVFAGLSRTGMATKLIFFSMGLLAITAAIKYTVGKRPYGYAGFGDLFVFIFFGLAGVMGTYFLITNHFQPAVLLPASAVGFLSMAVLNINNMRDRENDALSGKNTLVVRLGIRVARVYHLVLIVGSMLMGLTYMLINYRSPFQMFFLITVPFFWMNVYGVFRNTNPAELDPYLKRLALTTLLFSVIFGISLVL